MGERARSAKRGAHGPAPARKNRLWDSSAARKGALVVRSAHTGQVLSSKTATQAQLAEYVGLRVAQAVEAAIVAGVDLTRAPGRRWLRRHMAGCHENWVKAVTPDRLFWYAPAKFTPCESASVFVRVSPIR